MSNRTPKEALREIRNRIVYMYGNIDGTFNPPALKEVCEIADDAISSPITEKSSAVGNAAALREAVVALLDAMHSLGCDEETATLAASVPDMADSSAKCLAAFRKAKDALSAPPRNCERFNTVREAAIAFAAEYQKQPHPCPDFIFSCWLLATAAEQKGETK